ncbi:hypothetical protein [Natronococcus roseus]|uniref:hypothetical protein n=1 Tax=Natronococcus roseus TaxID=1052014 RepID=UPI00374C8EB5
MRDGEALEGFAGWVERGEATVEIYDTSLGRKVSPKTTAELGEEFTFSCDELKSSWAVSDWEGVILAVDDDELEAVKEVDGDVWEEFVTVASEALEEELRAARGE